jgi:hypothetical protein
MLAESRTEATEGGPLSENDEQVEESDPGFLGGGSVAEEVMPEDPESDEMHRPDTDHGEL